MAKICNINFWIENDPPPLLELFRKFIRFGRGKRPLGGRKRWKLRRMYVNAMDTVKLSFPKIILYYLYITSCWSEVRHQIVAVKTKNSVL